MQGSFSGNSRVYDEVSMMKNIYDFPEKIPVNTLNYRYLIFLLMMIPINWKQKTKQMKTAVIWTTSEEALL